MSNLSHTEIIKAFECCYLYDVTFCDKCPNKDTCGEIDVGESILNLINRLQADKEKSDKIIEELNEQIEHLVFLNETAKSEARKEFAERLKPKLFCGHPEMDACIRGNIDNLLKEMG